MNRLLHNGHTNGKLRFSASDWIGPQHGDRGGTYWESRKTGEKVYSPTNPGGQESQGEQAQPGRIREYLEAVPVVSHCGPRRMGRKRGYDNL